MTIDDEFGGALAEARHGDRTRWADTPLDAARRTAFDRPTVDNLRALEAAAIEEERPTRETLVAALREIGDRTTAVLLPDDDLETADSIDDLVAAFGRAHADGPLVVKDAALRTVLHRAVDLGRRSVVETFDEQKRQMLAAIDFLTPDGQALVHSVKTDTYDLVPVEALHRAGAPS